MGGDGALGGAGTGGGPAGASSTSGPGGWGGGVYTLSSQTVSLTNDTITRNVASSGGTGGAGPGSAGEGGGILQNGVGLTQLSFVTIAENTAAGTVGGIADVGLGSLAETDSIVASNNGSPARNCTVSTITDGGHNLVFGDNSCPGSDGDPRLAPLGDHGGPTPTMALAPGSAAVDLVPASACPANSDQRGVSRPQGPACDAGSYELAPPSLAGVAARPTRPRARQSPRR